MSLDKIITLGMVLAVIISIIGIRLHSRDYDTDSQKSQPSVGKR